MVCFCLLVNLPQYLQHRLFGLPLFSSDQFPFCADLQTFFSALDPVSECLSGIILPENTELSATFCQHFLYLTFPEKLFDVLIQHSQQKRQYHTALLWCSLLCHPGDRLPFRIRKASVQNLSDPVILSVLPINLIIRKKFGCCLFFLKILLHQHFFYRKSHFFITFQHCRQIFPSPCRHKLFFSVLLTDPIETISVCFQIRPDTAMYLIEQCIFHPDIEIRLQHDLSDTVQRRDVKFTHRFVVFRRVARCYDEPVRWKLLVSKRFVLEKLQHHRSKCL